MAGGQPVSSLIYILHVYFWVGAASTTCGRHIAIDTSRARILGHASPGTILGHTGPCTKEKPYKGEPMPPSSGERGLALAEAEALRAVWSHGGGHAGRGQDGKGKPQAGQTGKPGREREGGEGEREGEKMADMGSKRAKVSRGRATEKAIWLCSLQQGMGPFMSEAGIGMCWSHGVAVSRMAGLTGG